MVWGVENISKKKIDASCGGRHWNINNKETADELQNDWFNNIKKIGITAGASTPDWIIKEVYEKCKTWQAY